MMQLTVKKTQHFHIGYLQSITESAGQHFEIFVITSGSSFATINAKQYTLARNSVCFIIPGQIRSFDFNGFGRGYHLSFSSDFLFAGAASICCVSWKIHFYEMFDRKVFSCKGQLSSDIIVLLEKMVKEWNDSHFFHQEVIAGLLNVLLIDMSRLLPVSVVGVTESRDKALCREFIQLVGDCYLQYKQVNDYASLLFVSPGYLNTIVKKITGHTAKHHIQQQLITAAKKILVRDSSLKRTAFTLGFLDLAHFSKFFKKNAGINFKSYRKIYL